MNYSKSILIFFLLVFSTLTLFSQSLLIAAKEKGKKYGYINEQGGYVIAPTFDEAGGFYQGIAVVKKDKKFGIINAKGEFLVNPIYDDASIYAPEGKVSVMKAGKWGVIDRSGKIIIPLSYDYISVFANGYVVAGKYITQKGYKGMVCPTVLNEKNEVVFQVGQAKKEDGQSWVEYECTQLFLPGYADKKSNGYSAGWPIVREGKLILKESMEGGPQYANFKVLDVLTGKSLSFPQGMQPSDDSFGIRAGTIAMEIPEDRREELGDFTIGGFYDTANLNGEYLVNPLFNFAGQKVHPFFNGVAAVEKDDKWIFIDRDGEVISETQLSTKEYDATPPMYFNGLTAFWKNGKAGYVDITGKEIIPFTLEEYHPFEYDITPVKQNGLYGLIRKDGTWAVSPKFEYLLVSPCPCYQ